ncbi:hypothetical protein GCM10011611_09050 [Aliidongia dinghuensis]|uniref:Lipoprotein n=1 Tax=Aliidongia dinghuensis TaxID=1867774 RepID=A0A8J2YQI6_9PROT|nr:hypothetical protein [Aliidongia dinghuensis]GGF05759.1 hypothetical protein GCM10011611_09050 [Aliidongia dinghuensis]
MRSADRIGRGARVVLLASLLAGVAGCVARQEEPGETSLAVPLSAAAEAPADPGRAAAASASDNSAPVAAAPTVTAAATAPVSGSTEQITVLGRSFTGLWKVNSPKRLAMDVGLFSGVHIRYSGETGDRDICELRQTGTALDARCLRLDRTAAGSIDGNQIVLRSWVGPATLILKASAPTSSALTGTISGGALGTQLTGGVPIHATKLTVQGSGQGSGPERPSAPLLRAVLADIAQGHLTADRYAPEAAARLRRNLDDMRTDVAELGPLKDVTYLDQLLPRHPFDPRERPLEVYRVDYAGGTRLCGISPGPPAAVADVVCR